MNIMAKEHEKNPSVLPNNEFKASTSLGLLCEHKDSKVNYFALGMCESCYKDESGIFSDIDDEEVDGYLFNEKEVHYRNIIWENQRQEYESLGNEVNFDRLEKLFEHEPLADEEHY